MGASAVANRVLTSGGFRDLKVKRHIDRAELIGRGLRLVLLGADHMREADLHEVEGERSAEFEVADENVFVDVATRFPRVAVEEQVACDRPAIDADEDVAADVAGRLE